MKKILASLSIIGTVAIAAVSFSSAFFSDTETSTGNVLQAGKVDLKIDNESYYNKVLNAGTSWSLSDLTNQLFFNFTDIKPSDVGEDTISIHVDDNNAWACMSVNMTANEDNTCTEPELLDDPDCTSPGAGQGELAQNLNFVFWVDDGDNVLETGENVFKEGTASTLFNGSVWPLQDSITNLFEPAGSLLGTKTYYIGKAWCFGTLTQAALSQDGFGADSPQSPANTTGGVTCDGSLLNNATQTDKVTGDIQFNAYQSRNNPNFRCIPATPPPTPLISCTENDVIYASSASDNDQGLRKDSSAVLANRSVPSAAFGAPQTSGADSDVGFPVGSFFSLGFPLSSNTASIVFGFAEPFYPNPSGADLKVFEVTGGTYPDEKVEVEASVNPGGPWTVLSASATRDEDIELGSMTSAQYIRLTDVSNIALFPNDGDGYDVDALKAFCTQVNN